MQDPILIRSGKGVWLKDAEGRRLLDGNASLWVNVWGHNHAGLNRALQRQMKQIAHSTFLGLTHEPAVRLAKALVDIAPKGLSRVFYSDNGSTAVEVALKMAYQYGQLKGERQRTKFVALKDGYHGDTIGSVSVGGVDLFYERFKNLLFKGWHVSAGRIDEMERVLKRRRSHVAAVVLEPLVQGASGMRLMPKGYLAAVSRLCKRFGILLIVDEVATGFGRTGTMFACEQEKVSPDFLCVAKSLTGGYLPLAATLATENIFRSFLGRYDEFKTFFHGHTYTANPLACAVALENLALYRRKHLLRNVLARAAQFSAYASHFVDHPHVKEVRQVGLMIGIDLVHDKVRNKPYAPSLRMGVRVCEAAIRRGVWLRPLGDVIVLMPPLVISEKEFSFLMKKTKEAIEEATDTTN